MSEDIAINRKLWKAEKNKEKLDPMIISTYSKPRGIKVLQKKSASKNCGYLQ